MLFRSRWYQQYRDEDFILHEGSAADADHAWAVGNEKTQAVEEADAAASQSPSRGAILFYDGKAWTVQKETPKPMMDVYALDATHVWAVGAGGEVYFYDGTAWSLMDTL